MSTQISEAFVKQFQADVHLAYQQTGSKLKNMVRSQNNVKGSSTVFQKVGKGVASGKARHGLVPVMSLDHTPVECELQDYYAGDGYDATSSAGSNKGPTNAEYLAEVEARIDTFLKHHPYLSRKEVPAEMVTASGSGLDPDITPACAYVQVQRVAKARGMSEETVKAIVDKAVEKPFMGMFGTEKVNVLKLNAALEKAK